MNFIWLQQCRAITCIDVHHLILGIMWCLDFFNTVYGSSSGRLNVYLVVNGVKGDLLFSKVGTSNSRSWQRSFLFIDGTGLLETDMVEVRIYLSLQSYALAAQLLTQIQLLKVSKLLTSTIIPESLEQHHGSTCNLEQDSHFTEVSLFPRL